MAVVPRPKRPGYLPHSASPEQRAAYQAQWAAYGAWERAEYERHSKIAADEGKAVATCPLRPPGVGGLRNDHDRRKDCFWCGKPLPKMARKWCSDACSTAYFVQHAWPSASDRRVLLDSGRCRRCGSRAGAWRAHRKVRHDYENDLRVRANDDFWAFRALLNDPMPDEFQCWDLNCKGPDDDYRAAGWSAHGMSRGKLQVDHTVPREGRGYGEGCHNHQDVLQTLCTTCHGIAGSVRMRVKAALEAAARPALPSGMHYYNPDYEAMGDCRECGWPPGGPRHYPLSIDERIKQIELQWAE